MLSQQHKTHGFTLVEILTVLAIIVILMGISFPVFRTVQEKGAQSACMTKLQQIGLGVKQYKLDEGVYPATLEEISGYISLRTSTSGGKATATGGKDLLICPDDENTRDQSFTSSMLPYSSYYDVNATSKVWNYYGLKRKKTDGTTYSDSYLGYAYSGSVADETEYATLMTNAGITNTRQYPRLYNRFAPEYTIITHCVHHRQKSANNDNDKLDTVVLLSGQAKTVRYKTYDWNTQPD